MSAVATKWVYLFRDGSGDMRDLLGGKGAGVAEMTRAGMPVPPGFTITTEACREYLARGSALPDGLWEQVLAGLRDVEAQTGKGFGDPSNPLLVSVRSGAKFSMPGMMDTVLNLGLNAGTVEGLAMLTGNEAFALDAHRRFVQMYGRIVRGLDGDRFEEALSAAKQAQGVAHDGDLTAGSLRALLDSYQAIYRQGTGEEFPPDPHQQLLGAIAAVFGSWNGERARTYRRHEGIPDDLGTAVNVQAMVFGNMGGASGTGVVFTRNPIDGSDSLYGDYLENAQGEDVVAGIRETLPVAELERLQPEAYSQLREHCRRLERHYRDVQDVEFTIERGRLYMLQTRAAKRTGRAAVNLAVALERERLISRDEALGRVEPRQLEQLLHPSIDTGAAGEPIATGVPASPGAATGRAVFDPDRAVEAARGGAPVILVRVETDPNDVHGMIAARGVLTSTGGTASHAALVARGMGVPAVVGASALRVDLEAATLTVGDREIREGDEITIDGSSGAVYAGRVPTVEPELGPELQELLSWADAARRLEVWANADNPGDARRARANGAQGIGLCRTEHMFMEADRLPVVQAMIMAATLEEREAELAKLLPVQRSDFEGIFRAMAGLPVVIRLIDPPLHEFLPNYDELVAEEATLRATGADAPRLAGVSRLRERVDELREANPMLGLRGCRLGILFPEITRMQVRAIMEAACTLAAEGVAVKPEIMIPLVGTQGELRAVKADLAPVAEDVQRERGMEVPYKFGTMIEIPRAALIAARLAEDAEFFSFGTNDLTQTTYGYSRDDAERKFILAYVERGILPVNPFESIDPEGVGRLMEIGVAEGRRTRPDLEVGICGEHGGDPSSIHLCHRLGLNYVSCSPFRVTVARLAAAQAAVGEAR